MTSDFPPCPEDGILEESVGGTQPTGQSFGWSRGPAVPNPYQRIAHRLEISKITTQASEPNDLLPPRPEDKVSGELGKRYSEYLVRQLQKGEYDPIPAHIVPVPKSRLATRPAALLSLSDRVVYEAIVAILRPRITRFLLGEGIVFWPRGDLSSKKQWMEFEKTVLDEESDYIVRCDIAGFYESIDHERLANSIVNATGYGDVAEALLHLLQRVMRTGRGLPQGLISSDTLATVYLAEVDFAMIRNGFSYVRHGDDIRVAVDTYDHGCMAIRCMETALRKLGLLLNAEKTRVFRRQTYCKSLSSFQETWTEAKRQVVEAMAAQFRKDQNALEAAMIKFDMEELGWALFYHQAINLEEAIEVLRKQIRPEDVEIAQMLFQNAIQRRPRNGPRTDREAFHQQLTGALVRLTAARADTALSHVAELMASFPDKSEVLCRYMMALRGSDDAIARQIEGSMNEHVAEWGLAWMVRVLSQVPRSVSETTVDMLKDFVNNPGGRWLLAVEAAECLASMDKLERNALLGIWNTCPEVFRVDLLVAAVRMLGVAEWADGFVRSGRSDPVHEVAIRREMIKLGHTDWVDT